MRPWGYWFFRFSLFFLTLAPAFGAEPEFDPADGPVVHATPAMWTVHGPKGTAYLLGSFHALPVNVDWKTPQIRHAIQSANVFVFEIPLESDAVRQWSLLYGENILLPYSVSLPSYFDAQMRGEWRAAVMHTHIKADALVQLRPWYAARAFEGAMSGENMHLYSDEGVDNKIADIAKARGAPILGLETSQVHLHALMRDANTSNEIGQLRDAMHKAATMKMEPFSRLLAAWEAGDVKAIYAMNSHDDPVRHKALLTDRNQAWVPRIEKMLTQKRTFLVTVGAAHLAGPGSVVDLLRADGYTVEGPDSPGAQLSSASAK